MKKWLRGFILAVLLLGLITSAVFAQNYKFRVTTLDANYYINKDGTASVEYTYVFQNDSGGSPIDFIDVVIPVGQWSLKGVTANVDGKPITDIQNSSYVNGVAFGLGSNAIQPGQTGKVYIWIPAITNVIYPADTSTGKADYASVQFSPNHFDPQFVEGNTDMSVTLILPPGMTQDQPIFYPPQNWPGDEQPKPGMTQDNRVFYNWTSTNASEGEQYTFGAGFPKSLVPAAAIVNKPYTNPSSSGGGGGGASGGGGFNFNFGGLSNTFCCLIFGAFWVGIAVLGARGAQKRKMAYLPPKISMEGHGIKRGLTAVEVAVLMEQPVDKVMTMILFSVIKKNAARVATREPLALEIANPLPQGLNQYEIDFLDAFRTGDAKQRRKKLQDVLVGLVKSVTEKMRGFSRKETLAYYDSIMKDAWAQVEAAQTPEVKSQKYDEVMDWTMLDQNYPQRTRDVFSTGPVFVPIWWGNYDPVFRHSQMGGGTVSTGAPASVGGGGGGGRVSMPTLPGADFAASVVNGAQTMAAGVLGDLAAFTGGVTNVTNPPPPPSRGGGSFRGGGGGCACACACAGCACACAGGGR